MELVVDIALLGFMVMAALAITRLRDLFAAVMLAGIYSLLCASFFVLLDAVDVAFTEAAVGAGISTLLMLTTLALTGRYEKDSPPPRRSIAAMLVVSAAGVLLAYGLSDIPVFGSADAPAHRHVASYYIESTAQDTGVPNVVTAVLASYRGFDTFGELVVIFTAGIGVLALLTMSGTWRDDENGAVPMPNPMQEQTILRIVAKILIPLIMLFALYVQFHGDYGPGGGFQAGVIFAAAIILYSMLFGHSITERVISPRLLRSIAAFGVLLYGGVGVVSLLSGKNFLDYSALSDDPVAGQHLGILIIELGVGLTVASVMIVIFSAFSNHKSSGESAP
ncbi:MAG TPA: DUF4040 domain-containing protein [Gammaproteobacteria bacterium]